MSSPTQRTPVRSFPWRWRLRFLLVEWQFRLRGAWQSLRGDYP